MSIGDPAISQASAKITCYYEHGDPAILFHRNLLKSFVTMSMVTQLFYFTDHTGNCVSYNTGFGKNEGEWTGILNRL